MATARGKAVDLETVSFYFLGPSRLSSCSNEAAMAEDWQMWRV